MSRLQKEPRRTTTWSPERLKESTRQVVAQIPQQATVYCVLYRNDQ